jgi:peroxiredoxin
VGAEDFIVLSWWCLFTCLFPGGIDLVPLGPAGSCHSALLHTPRGVNFMSSKPAAGAAFPEIAVPAVGGGSLTLGRGGGWQMVVVYRGKHCPLCRRYLGQLEAMKAAFAGQEVAITLVSGDPLEKATAARDEWGLTLPLAYGLTVELMRALGLYVSQPRSAAETDRPFPEPGLFVVNPAGQLHIVDIANAPFARPDPQGLLDGIAWIRAKDYPIRGTLA